MFTLYFYYIFYVQHIQSSKKKYNPELICIADNLTDCIKKLNNDGIKSKVMFLGSIKSNRGYICFNNSCITLGIDIFFSFVLLFFSYNYNL